MTMAASLSSDVAPRAPRVRGGHVESYFLRANHPSRPLAFWAKATVLKPVGGMALQESWFVFFDGEESIEFKWNHARALFGSKRYVTRERTPGTGRHWSEPIRAMRSGITSASRTPSPS